MMLAGGTAPFSAAQLPLLSPWDHFVDLPVCEPATGQDIPACGRSCGRLAPGSAGRHAPCLL